MKRAVAIIFAAVLFTGLSGCSAQPTHHTGSDSSSSRSDSVASAPTSPVPAVPTATVPSVLNQAGEVAASTLAAAGFVVVTQDAAGTAVSDSTGWTVTSQSVAAGATTDVGSTVTLTVAQPAPPPAPVAAAPAPAPAAPAPAPAPAVPAPAPVVPGGGATALCNDGSLSFAAHHQGACSHHGGVAVWYK
nr:DUF3761 domain-containing protein [Lacisediminihabitans profunda]